MKLSNPVLHCDAAPIAEAWSWVEDRNAAGLIDMCQAVPAHLPPQSLRDYLADAIRRGEGSTYTDIRGIEALREALAANINERYNADVSAEDLLITAGCNQAFCSVIDAICEPGDEVIIPLPTYFNHNMWLSIREIEARYLSFNPETAEPDPQQAASLINDRTRAIVLVTPNNPSGAIYSPRTLSAFLELARERDIMLVVDETYRDFIDINQQPHNLFEDNSWRNHFVHLYSFSKVFSLTGYRTGAIAAGPAMLEQLKKIQDCTAICAPHAGQLAALFGLQHLHDWKIEKSEQLARRAIAIRKAFENPHLKYRLISAGAYFAYLEHPFRSSSREVVKKLIKQHKIVSLPGSYFGADQDQFIRFAFANVEESRFDDLIERLLASQQTGELR